jgi:hypothetical protein
MSGSRLTFDTVIAPESLALLFTSQMFGPSVNCSTASIAIPIKTATHNAIVMHPHPDLV